MCGSNRFESSGFTRKVVDGINQDVDGRLASFDCEQQQILAANKSNNYVGSFSNGNLNFDTPSTNMNYANPNVGLDSYENIGLPSTSFPILQVKSAPYPPRSDIQHSTNVPSRLNFLENSINVYRERVTGLLDPNRHFLKGNLQDLDPRSTKERECNKTDRKILFDDVADDIIACFSGRDFTESTTFENPTLTQGVFDVNHDLCSSKRRESEISNASFEFHPAFFSNGNISNALPIHQQFQSNIDCNNTNSYRTNDHDTPKRTHSMQYFAQANEPRSSEFVQPNNIQLSLRQGRHALNQAAFDHQVRDVLSSLQQGEPNQSFVSPQEKDLGLNSCVEMPNLFTHTTSSLPKTTYPNSISANTDDSAHQKYFSIDHFLTYEGEQQKNLPLESNQEQDPRVKYYNHSSIDFVGGPRNAFFLGNTNDYSTDQSFGRANEDVSSSTLHSLPLDIGNNNSNQSLLKKVQSSTESDSSSADTKEEFFLQFTCSMRQDASFEIEQNVRVRKRPKHEPRVKEYVEPRDVDVLLGRGSRTNIHPGNQRYLVVKDMLKARYVAASNDEKTQISQELVDMVHNWGGKFLKLEESHENNQAARKTESDSGRIRGNWYEVLNIVARRKASQSLRDINTPEERAAKRRKYGLDKKSKKL